MNKQEALNKLHELALQTKDENLRKQLQLIDVALLPDPNYFPVPKFRERCELSVNSFKKDVHLLKTKEKMDDLKNKMYIGINIYPELADLYIMLMRLKIIFDIDDYILGQKIDKKLTFQTNKLISA